MINRLKNDKKNNIFLFVIICFIVLLLIILLPFSYLLHFSLDDSYFYLKTAQNVSLGYGSSFDTINKTNGYHPLWFYILCVYYFIIKLFNITSPELIYRFTFLLTAIINIGTIIIVKKILGTIFQQGLINKILFFVLLNSSALVLFNIIGMETQLLIFLMCIYVLLYIQSLNNKNRLLINGFILGIIILTRLDSVLYILPFLFFYEIRNYKTKKLIIFRSIVLLFTFPLLFSFLYIIFNWIEFGNILPITAIIKSCGTKFYLFENFPYPLIYPINFILLLFILIIIVIYLIFVRQKIKTKIYFEIYKYFEVMFVSGLLFLFIPMSISRFGAPIWYYSIACFWAIILIIPIFDIYRKYNFYFIFAASTIFILYLTLFRIYYYKWDDVYNYAIKLKEKTEFSDRILQVDLSGIVGFYSERKIINGDGLINSFEYWHYLKNNNLKKYFERYPIDYYSTYSFNSPYEGNYFIDRLFKPGGIEFKYPINSIVLKFQRLYGGIFRKKYGYFYLIKIGGIINN
jgi:hypothetical protein